MSYQVLARKYRPHSFEALVGQEHVVQALANALTQQRLHHAYLFTGTRGVGKTTVSRILAKSLNCTGADGQGTITAQPCGVCEACRDIDAGRFVDYVELDAASNRGVEEISQLLDQAIYKPVVGRFKVYMIDEVHMLSNTAFNAMLKTLEEPPEYLKFVLATTDPQKVPVTVLSRCLQFNLRPMSPQNVLAHLGRVLETEQVPAEPGALRLLSRAARGSMRDALSLTDQAIAFGAGQLQEAGVRQMLGTVDRGHVVAILDALIASDGAAVVAQADRLRSLGLSAAGTLEDLASTLQQIAVAQAAPAALDEQDPDTQELRRLAPLLPADEVQLMYSLALHGRQELPLAPDEYAGLTMVLLRMLSFRPGGSAQTLSGSTPRAGASSAAGAPAVSAAPAAALPTAVSAPVAAPAAARAVSDVSDDKAVMPAHGPATAAQPAPMSPPAATSTAATPDAGPAEALEAREPAPTGMASAAAQAPEAPLAAAPLLRSDVASSSVEIAASAVVEQARAAASAVDMSGELLPETTTAPASAEPPERVETIAAPVAAPAPVQAVSQDAGPLRRPRPGDAPVPPSARLRPRPVAASAASEASAEPGGEELPPWLDAPPADEDGAATPSDVGLDLPEPTRAARAGADSAIYVSTAGSDVALQPTALGERWAALVPQLGLTALARELAMQAQCLAIDEQQSPQRWLLRVERDSLRQPALKDKLQAALAELQQQPVQIELEQGVATDSAALRESAAAQARQRRAEQIILEDPFVKQLLGQFKTARIVQGSIKPQ